MTMQRKIIFSALETERALAAIERTAPLRRIKATMLSMAGANQPGDAGWFVVQTKERQEKSVEERFSSENIRCYLPLVEGGKAVIRHRVVQVSDRPAMPGYLLVSVVPSPAAFMGLRSMKGVVGIVGGAEAPHRVSDVDINRFKIKLGQWDATKAHAEEFHVGDWVRFDEGPFIGFSGRIVKIRRASPMRGLAPIAIEGRVEVTANGQTHSVGAPLAFLIKV